VVGTQPAASGVTSALPATDALDIASLARANEPPRAQKSAWCPNVVPNALAADAAIRAYLRELADEVAERFRARSIS
jgi:hypothetical protein